MAFLLRRHTALNFGLVADLVMSSVAARFKQSLGIGVLGSLIIQGRTFLYHPAGVITRVRSATLDNNTRSWLIKNKCNAIVTANSPAKAVIFQLGMWHECSLLASSANNNVQGLSNNTDAMNWPLSHARSTVHGGTDKAFSLAMAEFCTWWRFRWQISSMLCRRFWYDGADGFNQLIHQ